MRIDSGRYTVRLAEDEADVAAAQRLRYRVFVEEMGAATTAEDRALRRERDAFDSVCDHLILIDNEADCADPLDKVVGVYRLLRGAVAQAHGGFYTANEYDLSVFDGYEGEVLELGRSCVERSYRSGAAVQLLWMGLAQYVLGNGIGLMFGCASFAGTDVDAVAEQLSYLHHWHLAPAALRTKVRPGSSTPTDLLPMDQVNEAVAKRALPPLIKGYLRLGGWIGDGAYIDHAFNTIDVCIIIETARISEKHTRYYGRQDAS